MYLDYFLSSYTTIIAQAVIFVKNAYAYTPVIWRQKIPICGDFFEVLAL